MLHTMICSLLLLVSLAFSYFLSVECRRMSENWISIKDEEFCAGEAGRGVCHVSRSNIAINAQVAMLQEYKFEKSSINLVLALM